MRTIKAGHIGLCALWITFAVTIVRPLWLGGNVDTIVGVLAVSLGVVFACASGVR